MDVWHIWHSLWMWGIHTAYPARRMWMVSPTPHRPTQGEKMKAELRQPWDEKIQAPKRMDSKPIIESNRG